MNLKSFNRIKAVILGLLIGGVSGYGLLAHGAVKGDQLPKASNGAVQILNSAATLVFTSSTQLTNRNAFALYNNGPNTIWCGWKSNVTSSTGFPVPASATLAVDLVAISASDANLYCIASTADQVSPADTRWIQVK